MKDSVDLLIDPVKGFHSNIERDVMENTNFRQGSVYQHTYAGSIDDA
jgi:hypothetical protein